MASAACLRLLDHGEGSRLCPRPWPAPGAGVGGAGPGSVAVTPAGGDSAPVVRCVHGAGCPGVGNGWFLWRKKTWQGSDGRFQGEHNAEIMTGAARCGWSEDHRAWTELSSGHLAGAGSCPSWVSPAPPGTDAEDPKPRGLCAWRRAPPQLGSLCKAWGGSPLPASDAFESRDRVCQVGCLPGLQKQIPPCLQIYYLHKHPARVCKLETQKAPRCGWCLAMPASPLGCLFPPDSWVSFFKNHFWAV